MNTTNKTSTRLLLKPGLGEWVHLSALCLAVLMLCGCAATMESRYTEDRPVINITPTTVSELEKLPPPAEKIRVSVWNFPDETGQNLRSAGGGTELSKAVTQGAHHMLIKALNDSGWFVVTERQSWPQLIQEIRIKEELRKRGITRVPDDFAHLAIPQYMISGAITEYDDHPVSFGAGFGLRGFFPSTRAMTASVAIDMRLVDIPTGRVYDAVSIYKRIISHQADLGIFRFIRFNWLLELEFGYTLNEPMHLAVREALEKAVVHLIVRGVREGLPGFEVANPEDLAFFENYRLDTTNLENEMLAKLLQDSGAEGYAYAEEEYDYDFDYDKEPGAQKVSGKMRSRKMMGRREVKGPKKPEESVALAKTPQAAEAPSDEAKATAVLAKAGGNVEDHGNHGSVISRKTASRKEVMEKKGHGHGGSATPAGAVTAAVDPLDEVDMTAVLAIGNYGFVKGESDE